MRLLIILFCLILSCQASALPLSILHWQSLSKGLEYTTLHPSENNEGGELHVFRINLADYHLSSVLARELEISSAYIRVLGEAMHALIAINGGFFTPDSKPLGLRINHGQILNPLKNVSWWGVFLIKDHLAQILSPRAYHPNHQIEFAVQAGPRLISNGRILPLKPSDMSERSALGITEQGLVIIAATDQLPMTTEELANIMLSSEEDGGLNCRDALNLDGGSSSQLYANIGDFSLNVTSFREVSDAVVVLPN